MQRTSNSDGFRRFRRISLLRGDIMKTSKEYQDNLKNRIITEEMFTDCLYSVNKRAKNYRDKAHEYKSRYRHSYIAVDSQYNKMNEFYALKERFLKYLEPVCIHKQFVGCQLPPTKVGGL